MHKNLWWSDSATWCDDPASVTMDHSDPWFCRHMDTQRFMIAALSELFPSSRPDDLLKTTYAEKIRSGSWTGHDDERVCLARCENVVRMIDSIIANGFDDSFSRIHPFKKGPTWWGPVGYRIEPSGRLSCFDGHHRTSICWLLGISFPAYIFAIHPDWAKLQKESVSYDWYPHATFRNGTFGRKASEIRFSRVAQWLRAVGVKSVIDIGSYEGHLPVILSKQGIDVISVEYFPHRQALGKSWFWAEQVSVQQCKTFQDAEPLANSDTAVTALSSIHHVVGSCGSEGLRLFAESVRKYRVLVFELANDDQNWVGELKGVGRTLLEKILKDFGYTRELLFYDPKNLRVTVGYSRKG